MKGFQVKNYKSIFVFQAIVLAFLFSGLSCKNVCLVYGDDKQPVYVLEFTRTEELDNPDGDVYEEIIELKQCKKSDITMVSMEKKEVVYNVQYQYPVVEEPVNDYIQIRLDCSKTTDIEKALLEQIQKNYEEPVILVDYYVTKITYNLLYSLVYESEEYNKSVSDFFDAPGTSEDSKAQLSGVSVYLQGYRVSYLLEDGGEYYIPCDALEDFENNDDFNDLMSADKSDDFYNLNYTTNRKVGTVIGKIKEVADEYGTSYEIKGLWYKKLSETFTDWRAQMKYNASENAFYYGSKPSASEKKLKTDEIYQFIKKSTKGCKTEKEKVEALHDAIVLRCHYDTKYYSYYNKTLSKNYNMTDTQAKALHMLQDKTGICENYSRLFKECCDRLFIPCELIKGDSGGVSHMWNRVYIEKEWYHVDVTYADYLGNQYRKARDIQKTFFLKSAYEFMGHRKWSGDDYKLVPFSKTWSEIDRNNIKTTDELRKAVAYASYQCRNGKEKTIKFKITGRGVQTNCTYAALNYGYVNSASSWYENGYLLVTFNYLASLYDYIS